MLALAYATSKICFSLCSQLARTTICDSHHYQHQIKRPHKEVFLFGQGWIRTTVLSREQIYSLSPLATRPPTHIQLSVSAISLLNLPLTRFELVTSPLPRECSTPEPQGLAQVCLLSSRYIRVHLCKPSDVPSGSKKAGNGTRTYNLRFTKPLLCQLSYAGTFASSIVCKKKICVKSFVLFIINLWKNWRFYYD